MLNPNWSTKLKIHTSRPQFKGIPATKVNLSSQRKLDWWLLFITVKAGAKSGYKRGDLAHDRRTLKKKRVTKKGGGTWRATCGPRKTFIKKGMGLRPCENIKTNLVHWAELDININTLRLSKHSIRNVGLKYDRHLLFPNLLPVHGFFFPDKQRCFGCSSCKVGEGFYFWCVRV